MAKAMNEGNSISAATPGTAGVVMRIETTTKAARADLRIVKIRTAMPCSIPQY